MEELRDASIHHTALKLFNNIRSMTLYENLLETVQKLACTPEVDKHDMKNTLESAIRANGLETEIRDIVYHLIRNNVTTELKNTIASNDPLNYLRRAGIQWERRVRKSLNAMCIELKQTMQGQARVTAERDELHGKWEELSNVQIDLTNYRPVYAPKDLLEVLLSLKGPSRSDEEMYPKWEFSHIAITVKNLFELRVHYLDLIRNDYKIDNWVEQCQKVVTSAHAPLSQHTLKKGNTPAQHRGSLWAQVLGSQVKPPVKRSRKDSLPPDVLNPARSDTHDTQHWESLKKSVLYTDLIVDKLVFKDVQLTATNDDQYFVFEDVLYQIMLCFSRDTEINRVLYPIEQILCVGDPNASSTAAPKVKTYEVPPSGVVPFHGICMFAAPFCYLFQSPVQLYFTFRAFYIRYCHRLTTINTHPQGIVSLCLLYEKLLQTHEPHLWSHFRELQIQPIRVVFKWLMRAFSGHLPPEELLILWDLILGFDSLEVIPLLAVVILSFRKESLLLVNSMESIEAVLADLSSIKVLPLIQLALTKD